MIHTSSGIILIDTTARPVDIRACLLSAGLTTDDIRLVLITHSHSDHTSGIHLFDCPVVAHRLAHQRIRKRGTERSATRMPTDTFEDRREIDMGGMHLELIHLGGHTPCSSVVWLPEERILFSGDLLFQGRYPFLATADVRKLMAAMRWLPSLEAQVIVPGHGVLCGNEELLKQLDYIEKTWERTAIHIKNGHDLQEILRDPGYPVCSERGYEKLHPWNINVIHRQLMKGAV